MLNGLLSPGDTVVDRVVDVISSKEIVTALQVVLTFGGLLSSTDAEKLRALVVNSQKEPPSLLSIGKQAMSKDARRSMAMVVGILDVLGDALHAQQTPRE